MIQKPGIPKGTRDFTPAEMVKRTYIFDSIRAVFTRYGYAPIETPAMENLSSLLGKYGDEGDKLLFKILNSGDFLKSSGKFDNEGQQDAPLTAAALAPLISEKGLRYDLTVPFARFVVQHRNELVFPFKRFQIQPVWRADRPQKGRYREFYQCDADVIGSTSLLCEAELVFMIKDIFRAFNIPFLIKLNNRKLLAGIAEVIGMPEKFTLITIAIDKLEKIGLEKVKEELLAQGINSQAWEKLLPFLEMSGKAFELLAQLETLLKDSETGQKGINEMRQLFHYLESQGELPETELDLTLARGLHYYTGAIIEVKATGVQIGSICGGGRYDDLTGIFGLPGVSGVGVSFGADRIYDVLEELQRFPPTLAASTQVLMTNFGKAEESFGLKLVQQIRQAGLATELYPEPTSLKKQLSYANAKQIPLVLIAGPDEISSGAITVKDMKNSQQHSLALPDLIPFLQSFQ